VPPPAQASRPEISISGRRPVRGGRFAVVLALSVLCLAAVGISVVKLTQKKPWNPFLSLSASPHVVMRGEQVRLQWSATNADGLRLDGEPVPSSGSRTVSPAQTTTYRLVAFGAAGKSESREVTVRVNEPAAAPAIQFTGDRDHIILGQSVRLQWSVTGASRIWIEPDLGSVDADGKRSVSPQRPTEYLITADGPGGTARDRFRVSIDARPHQSPEPTTAPPPPQNLPKIIAFEAAPATSIQQCQWVGLRWTVQGASRVSIGDETVTGLPYKLVQPLRTTLYVLRAEGPGGSVSRNVTVSVVPGSRSSCGR
jgi:hypothetical protein